MGFFACWGCRGGASVIKHLVPSPSVSVWGMLLQRYSLLTRVGGAGRGAAVLTASKGWVNVFPPPPLSGKRHGPNVKPLSVSHAVLHQRYLHFNFLLRDCFFLRSICEKAGRCRWSGALGVRGGNLWRDLHTPARHRPNLTCFRNACECVSNIQLGPWIKCNLQSRITEER